MSGWGRHREQIQAMVAAGLTDEEIGAHFGRSAQRMNNVRRELGIATQFRRKRKSLAEVFAAPEPEPLKGETYTDADGLAVIRYPARYAEGAFVQSVTARPRRG